jgi:hypothetical protein
MFTNPYISSELARDRHRELLAQATRQRLARANGKDRNRPGTYMIRIVFAAALLGALAAGLTKAHSDQDYNFASAAAVSTPIAQPFTGTGTGKRAHQPFVQKVRYNDF